MTPEYLGASGFAKRAGLKSGTIYTYLIKGMLPEPDIYYVTGTSKRPGWSVDTINYWINHRPGSGHAYVSMKENNQ